jgi:TolB-like protein
MKFAVLLAELKRRNVLRVAAVYGATSFAILQLTDIVFPALGLPQWTITLVVALAIIGLPMAVALAWTFDKSPDGLRRTAPAQHGELEAILAQPRSRRWPAGVAALVGLMLLAAGTAWTLGHRGGGRSSNYDSIAVLPFANMSGDAENEYFGDGLAEELLNALSSIEGLKVAARTSAFAFKNSNIDVRVIGDTLGVATVLEGSVRRSADRIRITTQLIDTRTGYHLWSETYDRPLTDLFSVQDAIAREIVGALAGRLTTSKKELYRGGTQDVQAYDLYLLGRQKWVTRKVPLLREAIQHFEQAIARDSSFALAWSGLADAMDALAWRDRAELDHVPAAKFAAQRALLLDPELAEAWASLGVLALDFDRDFRSAELALRRAIALKPSYAAPYNWLADALRFSGRVEESLPPSERGLELDPVSGLGMNGLLQTLTILGRWSEARVVADRLQSIGWTDLGTLINLLSAGPQLGYGADDLEKFATDWAASQHYSKPDEAGVIGRAIVELPLRPRARGVLGRMAAEGLSGHRLAELSVAIGDLEGAITNLTYALEKRDPTMIVIGTDQAFDPLRQDPRFIRMIEELRLPNGATRVSR